MDYNKLDISKLKKSELNKFVKKLTYTNKVIWDAICCCEEVMKSNIMLSYRNEMDDDKRKEFLKKVAEIFVVKNKYDDTMAEPELNDGNFADYEWFGQDLQIFLDKVYRR